MIAHVRTGGDRRPPADAARYAASVPDLARSQVTPVVTLASLFPSHPRSGAELAWALESTWAVVASCLDRWRPAMVHEPLALTFGEVVRYHSRGSILNRLMSHDAFQAGEISQLLGVHALPAIDLWTRDRTRP